MTIKKDEIIKKYYNSLILSLVAYVLLTIIINYIGLINLKDHILIYLGVTFLYYLIVKNIIQNYFLKKIYEVDPEFAERDKERSAHKYGLFKSLKNFKGLHKNIYIIYLVIVICIVLIYKWLK